MGPLCARPDDVIGGQEQVDSGRARLLQNSGVLTIARCPDQHRHLEQEPGGEGPPSP